MSAERPAVVLIGPPGAAVPEVAALVAARLGVALVDTDVLVEQAAGRTVAEVFWDAGEETFRVLEHVAVAAALTRGGVVALGGGAVGDGDTLARLDAYRAAGGTVVFLDVTLAHAVPRLGLNAPRPVGLGNVRAQWQEQMDHRRPRYLVVADHRVDTDDSSPSQVAEVVLALITES